MICPRILFAARLPSQLHKQVPCEWHNDVVHHSTSLALALCFTEQVLRERASQLSKENVYLPCDMAQVLLVIVGFAPVSSYFFLLLLASSCFFSLLLTSSCFFLLILTSSYFFLLLLTSSYFFLVLLTSSYLK